jgi:uncharacterized delta-60 repeat protein
VGRTCVTDPSGSCSAFNFAVVRYNPNGLLDPTFSGDGKQLTFGLTEANAVALQANGKIVAAGSGPAAFGASDPALARYNPNGTLDKTFSGDGRQITDFSGFENWASGVALQGKKIVAVGSGADNFAIARYNPNGSLDPTFSGNGKQTTDFGADDVAYALALQPNGKIVAVGSGGDFALARYLGG